MRGMVLLLIVVYHGWALPDIRSVSTQAVIILFIGRDASPCSSICNHLLQKFFVAVMS
jgi:hypothetical protein